MDLSRGALLVVRRVELRQSLEDAGIQKQLSTIANNMKMIMNIASPFVVKHHTMRVFELDESIRVDVYTDYLKNGSMSSMLRKCGSLSLLRVRDYSAELAIAVASLHSRHINVQGTHIESKSI